MNVAVVFFIFASLAIITHSQEFKFGGWSGVVEGFGRIDGKETSDNQQMSSKAEQTLKKLIEKHLSNKKKNRNQAAAVKQETPEKVIEPLQVPSSINWDDHKEARDLINNRITGGTQAINDMINLLREQQKSPE